MDIAQHVSEKSLVGFVVPVCACPNQWKQGNTPREEG